MRIVELLVTTALMWAPPQGEIPEGPEASPPDTSGPEPELEPEPEPEPEPDLDPTGVAVTTDQNPYTLPTDVEQPTTTGPDVAAIVEAAVEAAKDRAYLQRTNREVEEYVHQLDQLANVNGELDTCARAIQAELRMALALAYLEAEGTCADAQDDASPDDAPKAADAQANQAPLPVLECFEAAGPSECADRLLEQVAEFASEGPAGPPAPFSQAFGCPHAAAQMSVEQMFGACLSNEYDQAITRWEVGQHPEGLQDQGPEPLPVPRWASITGVTGGAALLITGGVLLGINGTCPGGNDPVTEVDQCPSVYNTDVSGGVLVGVGAVAVLSMGAILTITELRRAKRGKTRDSALRRRIDRAEALTGLRLSLTEWR